MERDGDPARNGERPDRIADLRLSQSAGFDNREQPFALEIPEHFGETPTGAGEVSSGFPPRERINAGRLAT